MEERGWRRWRWLIPMAFNVIAIAVSLVVLLMQLGVLTTP